MEGMCICAGFHTELFALIRLALAGDARATFPQGKAGDTDRDRRESLLCKKVPGVCSGLLQIAFQICGFQGISTHLLKLPAGLAAVVKANHRAPAETQIFHRAAPGAALV